MNMPVTGIAYQGVCRNRYCPNTTELPAKYCTECLMGLEATLEERGGKIEGPVSSYMEYPEAQTIEADPCGKSPHESGAKLDKGKNRLDLVMSGFANALIAVGEIGTFGAAKYTDDGWMDVPNGQQRYTDAMLRHYFKESMGEYLDPDSRLTHAAHLAWNALARLELQLREKIPEK